MMHAGSPVPCTAELVSAWHYILFGSSGAIIVWYIRDNELLSEEGHQP